MGINKVTIGEKVKVKSVLQLFSEGWEVGQGFEEDDQLDYIHHPQIPEYFAITDDIAVGVYEVREIGTWLQDTFTFSGSYHHYHPWMVEKLFDIQSIYKEF